MDTLLIVTKSLILLSAASIAGLIAQIDASLWEKSAWVIMCVLFLTGLTVLWRVNQKLVDNRDKDAEKEIERLRERVRLLENQEQDR